MSFVKSINIKDAVYSSATAWDCSTITKSWNKLLASDSTSNHASFRDQSTPTDIASDQTTPSCDQTTSTAAVSQSISHMSGMLPVSESPFTLDTCEQLS